MPKTFNGAASSYATPADFLLMADARLIGDLVRDDGSEATPTQLLTDPVVIRALATGWGVVEAVLLKSRRYDSADLLSIPKSSPAGAVLGWLNGGQSLPFFRSRRGYQGMQEVPWFKDSLDMLSRLGSGEIDLPFEETEDAGLPETDPILPTDRYFYNPTLLTLNPRYFPAPRNSWGGSGPGPGGTYGAF
jgi:hypothetical protein